MSDMPAWNLKDLYSGMNDKKIKNNLTKQSVASDQFSKKYKSQLSKKIKKAQDLKKILKEYESIRINLDKPLIYAQLLLAETGTDSKRGVFLQATTKTYQEISNKLVFFELELLSLPDRLLKQFVNNKDLSTYKHYLERLLQSKKHRLSEDQEQLMSDLSLSGSRAFIRLFDEEWAHKKFTFKGRTLSETEVLHQLYHPKAEIRKAGADSLSKGLNEELRRMAFITNTLIQNKTTVDKHRKFKNPEESRHLENDTSQKSVDIMCEVVTENYKLVHEFYKYKAKLLGVKKLSDSDRYAPIGKSTKSYSVKEAKTLVLDAFYGFSNDYGDIAKKFFDKNWIDFKKRPGKRGGAFCSFVTPDVHPYVFMNFEGSLRDVKTLAHELGHAIHAYLMRDLTYLNFDVPLTVAETASVFAEMVLFNHIKLTLKSKSDLQALYVHKLENSFATCYRQVSMFLFERDIHEQYRTSGELTPEKINAAWRKRQLEMFGNSIDISSNYDQWWAYIPHFIHTPFYVYAYAFGELLTLGLYDKYQKSGESFVPKYMTFLSLGGTQKPEDLVRPMGINLNSAKFWQSGIDQLKGFMSQLKGF